MNIKIINQSKDISRVIINEPKTYNALSFKNLGDLKFDDVSSNWGLDYLGVSTGSALGDLYGDGDLDIIMNGFDDAVRLYDNNLNNKKEKIKS